MLFAVTLYSYTMYTVPESLYFFQRFIDLIQDLHFSTSLPHRFFISLEFSEYFYIFDIFVLNQTYNLKEDLLNIKRYNKNA